jgi:two-component system OmpR family response regulator
MNQSAHSINRSEIDWVHSRHEEAGALAPCRAQPGPSHARLQSGHTVEPAAVKIPPHIVVIDDDPSIREALADYLADSDLRVTALASGRELAEVMARETIDLLLLDLRLPGEDGMEMARKLREESALPIIVLSGRKDEADRVIALEMAADDYLTKPCSPRELLARIRAVLRRCRLELRQGRPEGVRAYRFDCWDLNLSTRRLAATDGRQITLSNAEFNLLVVLLSSPQRVLTRDQMLDLSRLHNDEVFNRSIDVQIARLRRKIETDPANPRYIRTERGAGYRFDLPVQIIY